MNKIEQALGHKPGVDAEGYYLLQQFFLAVGGMAATSLIAGPALGIAQRQGAGLTETTCAVIFLSAELLGAVIATQLNARSAAKGLSGSRNSSPAPK